MNGTEHRRSRRTERFADTPDRVQQAARQMREQAAYGVSSGNGGGGWGNPSAPPQEGWQQNQALQQQQQYYQQQYYQQQQQYAWEMEQQRLREQQAAERSRVTGQAAAGNLRGFTVPSTSGGSGGKKKNGGMIGLILLLVLLVGAGAVWGVTALRNQQRAREIHEAVSPYDSLFCNGVYVDGIHLGGMTPEQALNSVQSRIQQRSDAWSVTLTFEGKQVAQINAGMLGMQVDVGQVMNEAWMQGHTGTEEERYAAMAALQETPYEAYTAAPSGDTSVIDSVLEQVRSQIDRPAKDAALVAFDTTQPYPFVFDNEVEGRQLDTAQVREQLYHMVATMTSGNVELQPAVIAPSVRVADLQKHYMLRSSVYTPISTSSTDERNNNIRRAFEAIDGYVLQPGSTFSFNNVVGQRTLANGFFEAIEYAYGEHVMGVGGGVCQASTTVYQAAVCAGLQITKREPHSDAVSYTEYGKDATVYWVGKRKIDLVFRNNTEEPIYMVASVQQDPSNKRRLIAKVSMYGADMGDVRYEIETVTVKEIEPPEKPTYVKDTEGTYVTYVDQEKSVSKAKPGYVVESYRVEYRGNEVTDRTRLFVDTYQPKAERIYVGVSYRE